MSTSRSVLTELYSKLSTAGIYPTSFGGGGHQRSYSETYRDCQQIFLRSWVRDLQPSRFFSFFAAFFHHLRPNLCIVIGAWRIYQRKHRSIYFARSILDTLLVWSCGPCTHPSQTRHARLAKASILCTRQYICTLLNSLPFLTNKRRASSTKRSKTNVALGVAFDPLGDRAQERHVSKPRVKRPVQEQNEYNKLGERS